MDPERFSALYTAEANAVLVFCARRVLDAEIALDLTAETFAQAWIGRRSLRGEHELEVRAWLFTIARRQVGRYLRRGAVERRALDQLGVALPGYHEDDLAAVEEQAGLAGVRGSLAGELERLAASQREALQLRVVEERSYPEVAAALGISEDNARARVSRGLRTLAAALERPTTSEARP